MHQSQIRVSRATPWLGRARIRVGFHYGRFRNAGSIAPTGIRGVKAGTCRPDENVMVKTIPSLDSVAVGTIVCTEAYRFILPTLANESLGLGWARTYGG